MYETQLEGFYTPNPYIGGKYSNIDRYEKIFIDIDRNKFKDKIQEMNRNNIVLYDYVEIHKSAKTDNIHIFYILDELIENEMYYFSYELFDEIRKPFMYKIAHQMLYDYYNIFGSDPVLKNRYNQPFRFRDSEKYYDVIKYGTPINIEELFNYVYKNAPFNIKLHYIKFVLTEIAKLNDELNNIKFLFSPSDYINMYKTKTIIKTSPVNKILNIINYVVNDVWPIAEGYRQYMTMCFCGMLYKYVSKDKDTIKEILKSILMGKDDELQKRLSVADYLRNKNGVLYGIPKLLDILSLINQKYKSNVINILKSRNTNTNSKYSYENNVKQIKINRKKFSHFEILQASVIFILIKMFRQEYEFTKSELRLFLKNYFNVTKKYAFHSRAINSVLNVLRKFGLIDNIKTRKCYINFRYNLYDELVNNIKYDVLRNQLIIFNLNKILTESKSNNIYNDITVLLSKSFLWYYNYKHFNNKIDCIDHVECIDFFV